MTNRPGNCVLVICTCCLILLGGCENRPKTAMGSIIGGSALGTGAFLVSKDSDHTFPITVASTALGALIGGGIGNALDKTDNKRKVLTAAIQIALESKRTNEKVEWKSPTKDTGGAVIPRQTFQKSSGEWCRKFDYHIMHNLRVSSGKGLACRNEKTGIWETIGTPSLSTQRFEMNGYSQNHCKGINIPICKTYVYGVRKDRSRKRTLRTMTRLGDSLLKSIFINQ